MDETKIKVSEVPYRNYDTGTIKISKDIARRLRLRAGDTIRITNPNNNRSSVAVYIGYCDEGVMLDPQIRGEIGITLGDEVVINKINVPTANSVVLSPINVTLPPNIGELLDGKIVKKGSVIVLNTMRMKVIETDPDRFVSISLSTGIHVTDPVDEEENRRHITYEDIGGLGDAITKVREMIELPIKYPELFKKLKIAPPKGVILYGPPGTGKTLIAKAVANETRAHFISIKGPEIMNKFYGQSEENLRSIFIEAQKKAPSIIFIDELDSIAPKRDEVTGDLEQRVVGQLLTLMDGLEDRGDVIVIGATNRINSIDEALRRPGRFDREIEIGVPDIEGRKEILSIHLRNVVTDSLDIDEIAERTHGYVGADLEHLVREATFVALRRYNYCIENGDLSDSLITQFRVTMNDFEKAIKIVTPSAMREVTIKTPKETWDDVGGLDDVKIQLQQAVEWKLKFPNIYNKLKGRNIKGILLYGPPGTGKTLIAKALAHETEANFISIKGPELLSKWVGESEKGIRKIFEKARQTSPCIVFFDEIDSIASYRRGGSNSVTDRMVSQLLTELDGLEELYNVIVIGATNRPEMLDPALLRPGRFDIHIEIPVPDDEARMSIIEIHTRDIPLDPKISLDSLCSLMEGMTGAEIEAVCKEASNIAIMEYILSNKRDINENEKVFVTITHFQKAVDKLEKNFNINRKVYENKSDAFYS